MVKMKRRDISHLKRTTRHNHTIMVHDVHAWESRSDGCRRWGYKTSGYTKELHFVKERSYEHIAHMVLEKHRHSTTDTISMKKV